MPEASWLNLAIQIPIVVLFAIVMLKMQETFLKHLSESETRSKQFIKEQREENNKALKDNTDRMCFQFDSMDKRLDAMVILNVGHDAYLRTSFGERYGVEAAAHAAEAATRAAQAAMQERK